MCGVCGIVSANADQIADLNALHAMNDALHHRGPDDEGIWHDGPVALGARRLSIIDIEHGHQPMRSDDGAMTLVFNGEIYNAAAMRANLEKRGHTFHTHCDTEVVLRAHEAYGEKAVERLNGMFAYALYDSNQQTLLLFRDRLGIKPLYWTFQNGTLLFASELDSLLRSGMVEKELNFAALDDYFRRLYISGAQTIFENVFQLGAGERLAFNEGEPKITRYWQPEFRIDTTWTLDSAAEAYLELLRDAVQMQRVSDVPLGAFLSGGLDSSSVVALLSEMGGPPVKTFSIGFDDSEANELPYARCVAEHFATDHTEEIMTPNPVATLPELTRHFAQPFADSSALPMWLVSKLARQNVTVALSGDGGDELFAGYTWLHMNRRVAEYRHVPKALRSIIDSALRLAPNTSTMNRVRAFSRDSFLDAHTSFHRRQTRFSAEQREALYRSDIPRGLEYAPQDNAEASDLSEDDWMLAQDLAHYLPDDILTKVDRTSMAVSLETRVPLLDHRIVEFACTLPFELKYQGGISKRVVKQAFKDILPQKILEQRKRGFSIPVQRWFREDLSEHFREVALAPGAHCHEYLNEKAMGTVLNDHLSQKANLGHHLWAVLAFEHWLQYINSV